MDDSHDPYQALRALSINERFAVAAHHYSKVWEAVEQLEPQPALRGFALGLELGFHLTLENGWEYLAPAWERAWQEGKQT